MAKSNSDRVDLPLPLNPADPLHQFAFATGGGEDRFNTYPGMDGIPHRAKGVRLYRKDDPARSQPQPGGQVRCMLFDISKPEEKQAYEKQASRIFTMAQQGKAVFCAIERNFDSGSGSMKVYVEWIEYYTYDPTGPREHTHAEPGLLRRR